MKCIKKYAMSTVEKEDKTTAKHTQNKGHERSIEQKCQRKPDKLAKTQN